MTIEKYKTNMRRRNAVRVLTAGAVPLLWQSPIVTSVILPAHATTTDTCDSVRQVGGPLIGNPYGAESCQEACEAFTADNDLKLCAVSEDDGPGGIQCTCDVSDS